MKKFTAFCSASLLVMLLTSWGFVGHRTIGVIAENHLTPKAKAGIHALLGDTAIADVASWADQVRGNDPIINILRPGIIWNLQWA